MTTPRSTPALAAQRETLARYTVHNLVLSTYWYVPVLAVRTERVTRQRGELLSVAPLDVLIVTNPPKGVHA